MFLRMFAPQSVSVAALPISWNRKKQCHYGWVFQIYLLLQWRGLCMLSCFFHSGSIGLGIYARATTMNSYFPGNTFPCLYVRWLCPRPFVKPVVPLEHHSSLKPRPTSERCGLRLLLLAFILALGIALAWLLVEDLAGEDLKESKVKISESMYTFPTANGMEKWERLIPMCWFLML